jgi:hypothetical protein
MRRTPRFKLQRDEQVAEWISIKETLLSQNATKGLGHRPEGGRNARLLLKPILSGVPRDLDIMRRRGWG